MKSHQGGIASVMRTSTRKITTITASLALAVGATFSLSGCFGNPLENLAQGGANEIIKNATGADIDLGGTSIPQDFPPQIPVIDGKIETAGSITVEGDKIWTIRIKTDDPQAFKKVQAELLANGFEEGFVTEGESAMGSYDGHGWGLLLSMDATDGSYNLTYIVSANDDD